MTDVTFKTISECRLELVAHTTMSAEFITSSVHVADANLLPVSAARASFQNESKTGKKPEADLKLMHSLVRDGHMGVFEHQSATFLIECPLFIRSQIMRHRTGAYNEWSRRYTSEKISFWMPDKWRKQSTSNKQASTDEEVNPWDFITWLGWEKNESDVPIPTGSRNNSDPVVTWKWSCYESWHTYLAYLESGLCREQARAVLPQALLTQFYMTMNLRNWVHFLKLRLEHGAQYEVRVVAERIAQKLRELWPVPMSVLLPEDQ